MDPINGNLDFRAIEEPLVIGGVTLKGLQVWYSAEDYDRNAWDELHLAIEVWCIRMFGSQASHVWIMDWMGRFYFANDQDRMLFKLTWC